MSDIVFNDDNEFAYFQGQNRSQIYGVDYNDLWAATDPLPATYMAAGMTFLSITQDGSPRYIGVNSRDFANPSVRLYRCEKGGTDNGKLSRVADESAIGGVQLPGYTYSFIESSRRGCVSPLPPSIYIPSSSSEMSLDSWPYTSYNMNSRLIGFLNGEVDSSFYFKAVQGVYEAARMWQRPVHLNGTSLNIGDIYYEWDRVFVPFEDDEGKLLVSTPNEETGTIDFGLYASIDHNSGMDIVKFTEGGSVVSPRFRYSEMVFHPTKPVAFIADYLDSGIYVINLTEMNPYGVYTDAVKYIHPKRKTSSADKTSNVAISGDGKYVMCKSETNRAIYPFQVKFDEHGRCTLEAARAIIPDASLTAQFRWRIQFAAGQHNGVYVPVGGADLWYFEITNEADKVTTEPKKVVTLPAGSISHAVADPDRILLGVRASGAAAGGDAVYYYKIGNWDYEIYFIDPELFPMNNNRPLIPLNGPARVRVHVRRMLDKKPIEPTEADVFMSYTVTGEGDPYEFPKTAMSYVGNNGLFLTTINPPKAGEIQIRCYVRPKEEKMEDTAILIGDVSDKPRPIINVKARPRGVLIPTKMKQKVRVYVSGKAYWGMAATGWDEKKITVTEVNSGHKEEYNAYYDAGETSFEVTFSEVLSELPYNTPLSFTAVAEAKRGAPPNDETVDSQTVNLTPKPNTCVISLLKLMGSEIPGQSNALVTFTGKLLDYYASYEWHYNYPPWGQSFGFEFKGKDIEKFLGIDIPFVGEFEFGIGFEGRMKFGMFSDINKVPVAKEGKGELKVNIKIPLPAFKLDTTGGINSKLKAANLPDCDKVTVMANNPKGEIGGTFGIGAEVGGYLLLNKIPFGKKIIKLLRLKKLKDIIDELFTGNVGVQFDPKGTFKAIKDTSKFGYQFKEFNGTNKTSINFSLEGKIPSVIALKAIFTSGLTQDLTPLNILALATPANIFLPIIGFDAELKGDKKFGPSINISGPLTVKPWWEYHYPPRGGGGVKYLKEGEPYDFRKTPNYNRVLVDKYGKISSNGGPQTLVQNVFSFAEPFQIVSGNKRMVIYLHSREGLPLDRSTEIGFLYFEGDTLLASGNAWEDTRFQDDPKAVFTSDGDVLLVCQSIKIDDLTMPDTDDITDLNYASPYQEIAWALFDTSSKTWSAPTYLTDDDKEDFAPELMADHNGDPLLFFQKSSDGNFYVTETATTTLKYSSYNGTDFTAPADLLSNQGMPIVMDSRAYSGKTWLVYSKDQDDDGATTPDLQLYCTSFTGDPGSWSLPPTQITSDAAFNKAPHLLFDETGAVRLIWQKDDKIMSSIGEPLGQNPTVIMSDQGPGSSFNTFFLQLENGDILGVSTGYSANQGEGDDILVPEGLYDYVDPSTGTLGIQNFTSDGGMEQSMGAIQLPDGQITSLYLTQEIIKGEIDGDFQFGFGEANIVLHNFTPTIPESYRIGIAIDAPASVEPDKEFQVKLIPNRKMKVYSCDFKFTIPEGFSIEALQAATGLEQSSIDATKRIAFIKRSGQTQMVEIPDSTPMATLTLKATAGTPGGSYILKLTDEDGGLDYFTTEVVKGHFERGEATVEIQAGTIGESWMMY